MPRRPATAPLTSLALVLAGCATGTTALWREGISRAGLDGPAPVASRSPGEVTVHLKPELGLLEEVESRRSWMDGTTQVYRRAFLLEPEGEPPPPAGPLEVLGWVTSEEFPRDEARSRLAGDEVFTVLGLGRDAFDLFEVRLDPAFRPDALWRLRELGAALGAEAVVDVFATGEAEHHMFLGSVMSLNLTGAWSPLYANMRLLDFRLRDVRLHGTAVRRAR